MVLVSKSNEAGLRFLRIFVINMKTKFQIKLHLTNNFFLKVTNSGETGIRQ